MATFKATTATRKILALKKRIRAVCGGTSASKTISILLYLIDKAQSSNNKLISVVSESMPHIKKGAERDFKNIMQSHKYWKESSWNATDHIYTFETGSKIEFFSADQSDKCRGPRRDILFINEANNIPFEAYNQLEVRSNDEVWLDWNPTNEFWFYTDILNNPLMEVDFITLTYKDNEALSENIVKSIESRKSNKSWWTVYGLGQLGEVEGKIYTGWQIIDDIPHEAKLMRRGLDYGYSNDPTTIIDIYYYNGGYILDEQLYQKGMSNQQIADFIKNLPEPQTLVKPDSAEPKSNDELKLYGINLIPVTKGKDSVNQGIQHVQNQKISMTKRSVNLIKEYRNYMWETDKDGKILNVPIDAFNHALDATRYGFEGLGEPQQEVYIPAFTGFGGYEIEGQNL